MRCKFVCDHCGAEQIKGANSRYCDFCEGGLTKIGKPFHVESKYSDKLIKRTERKEPMEIQKTVKVNAHVDELTRYGSNILFVYSDANGWYIEDEQSAKDAAKHYKEVSGIELPHQFLMDIAESLKTSRKELVEELKKDLVDCYKKANQWSPDK